MHMQYVDMYVHRCANSGVMYVCMRTSQMHLNLYKHVIVATYVCMFVCSRSSVSLVCDLKKISIFTSANFDLKSPPSVPFECMRM